ncbi:hypothetical protein [Paraburkholderia sp. RL17-383-BIF-A]|uniref:hypothetical protein n=1 Tax=Paraburkholderia sp. RL17-383-BIF-A TaxID=3031631 RepID=UPI0038B862EA
MKERPILFSGPMVRALLDGSKTQTRRIVKPQPWPSARSGHYHPSCPSGSGGIHPASAIFSERETFDPPWAAPQPITCPFGEPGDRLWVRETHDVNRLGVETFQNGRERFYAGIAYKADDGRHEADITERLYQTLDQTESRGWTPSIHMPRWASRITLEVTGVRVERLQDISEADAAAEGVESLRNEGEYWKNYLESTADCDALICLSARESFRTLWDSLAAPGSDWNANSWVWVVEFKRVT